MAHKHAEAMMKLTYRYRTNGLAFEDVVTNIKAVLHNDLIYVDFDTSDKYVLVDTNSSLIAWGHHYLVLEITPLIYENGTYLQYEDIDAYLAHPEYYHLELLIEVEQGHSAIVTPLKHSYRVVYVPNARLFDVETESVELEALA